MGKNPETELGRRVVVSNSRLIADANSVAQIPANRQRVMLTISNDNATIVYVNFTDQPAAGAGIPIAANGDRWDLKGVDIGDAIQSPIWLRMAAPGTAVWIAEFCQAK